VQQRASLPAWTLLRHSWSSQSSPWGYPPNRATHDERGN
jgi:hypothetical protein